jgi:hypothetical protein
MNTANSTDDGQGSRGPLYGINAALLRSEIGFWQEMIDSSDKPLSPDALERMEQALALAKSRLESLASKYRQAPGKSKQSHGNVYCIKSHRTYV